VDITSHDANRAAVVSGGVVTLYAVGTTAGTAV
jgi:hypothetical protein